MQAVYLRICKEGLEEHGRVRIRRTVRATSACLMGAAHPEEPVVRAGEPGLSVLVITNQYLVVGVVRAYIEDKRLDLRPLVGSEIWLLVGNQPGKGMVYGRSLVSCRNSTRGGAATQGARISR
jgi:hypothetical protein